MASTKLSNIINPSIFLDYMMEMQAERSTILRSRMVQRSPIFDALAAGKSTVFNLPFFQNLSGDAEAIDEADTLTINNITATKQIACRLYRGKAWGATDFAAIAAGEDIMRAIAMKAVDFWEQDLQNALTSTIKGILADNVANDSSDLVYNIASEDGNNATAGNKFSASALITAEDLLGDAQAKLAVLMMHSVVYSVLKSANLIDFIRESDNTPPRAQYRGYDLIVNDNVTKVAGSTSGYKYYTYLVAQGAIAYGEATGDYSVEVDRDSLAGGGTDILVTRKNVIIHPNGFSFQSDTISESTPTNANLALAANWDRVYEKKNTGIVTLISN
jgi:hypothetical protein